MEATNIGDVGRKLDGSTELGISSLSRSRCLAVYSQSNYLVFFFHLESSKHGRKERRIYIVNWFIHIQEERKQATFWDQSVFFCLCLCLRAREEPVLTVNGDLSYDLTAI